ncbi:unnamed protein product, partial [Didymodactylos carnosus]
MTKEVIFQQDGAPVHFSKAVRSWLNNKFSGRWIGREQDPYLNIRLMDVKIKELPENYVDNLEKVLDKELNYISKKKGHPCQKIDFFQQDGYPLQEGRFMDIKIRGACTDEDTSK